MPPLDTSPQAVVRYLTRILAAMCQENGGEIRIPRKELRRVEDETSRQLLTEDVDTEKDELVLRFGSKHSAVYPVEPECLTPKAAQPTTTVSTQGSQPISTPSSRKPMSPDQLLKLEKNIRARRVEATLKQEQETGQRDLYEILGSSSTG